MTNTIYKNNIQVERHAEYFTLKDLKSRFMYDLPKTKEGAFAFLDKDFDYFQKILVNKIEQIGTPKVTVKTIKVKEKITKTVIKNGKKVKVKK